MLTLSYVTAAVVLLEKRLTILKALEVCCVLVTNHRNVSENLNNFVKASGSVGEKKEDSGPAADCREGSVFTAKLEI